MTRAPFWLLGAIVFGCAVAVPRAEPPRHDDPLTQSSPTDYDDGGVHTAPPPAYGNKVAKLAEAGDALAEH